MGSLKFILLGISALCLFVTTAHSAENSANGAEAAQSAKRGGGGGGGHAGGGGGGGGGGAHFSGGGGGGGYHPSAPSYNPAPVYHPAPVYNPEPVYHPEPQQPVYHPEPQQPTQPVYHPEPQQPTQPVYHPEPQQPTQPVYHPEQPEQPQQPQHPIWHPPTTTNPTPENPGHNEPGINQPQHPNEPGINQPQNPVWHPSQPENQNPAVHPGNGVHVNPAPVQHQSAQNHNWQPGVTVPDHQEAPHVPAFQPGHEFGIQPNHQVQSIAPKSQVQHAGPSNRENPIYKQNSQASYQRVLGRRDKFPSVIASTRQHQGEFHDKYESFYHGRGQKFAGYCRDPHYHDYYDQWYAFGFFGGYYYPVNECDAIEDYFEYPVVYWFYTDDSDSDYYSSYYTGDDSDAYQANPVQPFAFAGSFFPTDMLRDLAIEVGSLPYTQASNFMQGITDDTQQVRQAISTALGQDFTYGDGDIVVTYYQNLQNAAYDIEGFVDRDDLHVPFKMLVDLNDPAYSGAFAAMNPDPASQDHSVLDWINSRITELGGDPTVGNEEPLPPAPAPSN